MKWVVNDHVWVQRVTKQMSPTTHPCPMEAFITTLTMIGVVTLPLAIKEPGKEMSFLRNGLSFIIAIAIALIIGMIQ